MRPTSTTTSLPQETVVNVHLQTSCIALECFEPDASPLSLSASSPRTPCHGAQIDIPWTPCWLSDADDGTVVVSGFLYPSAHAKLLQPALTPARHGLLPLSKSPRHRWCPGGGILFISTMLEG